MSRFCASLCKRTPLLCGYRPLNRSARLGQQLGMATWKRSKLRAFAIQFIVLGRNESVSHRWSSVLMSRMLGFAEACGATAEGPIERAVAADATEGVATDSVVSRTATPIRRLSRRIR